MCKICGSYLYFLHKKENVNQSLYLTYTMQELLDELDVIEYFDYHVVLVKLQNLAPETPSFLAMGVSKKSNSQKVIVTM